MEQGSVLDSALFVHKMKVWSCCLPDLGGGKGYGGYVVR